MVPLALRVAILAHLFDTLLSFVLFTKPYDSQYAVRIALFTNGVSFMADAFALYGSLELARQLVGRASVGAKLMAFGWFVSVVMSVIVVATRMSSDFDWLRSISAYLGWSWFVAKLCIAIGLALAAWNRPMLAVVGTLVFLAAVHPPVIEHWFSQQVGESYKYVRFVLQVANAVMMLVLVITAVVDLPADFVMREPQRAKAGLARMSNSLWMRVCALVVVPLLTLVMVSGDGAGADKVLGYAGLFAAGVNILSFIGFGIGALEVARSRHPDVRSGPFLAAAAGSLWCAGVSLHQIPGLWGTISGHDSARYFGENLAKLFPYALPIVAALAIIAAALAIAGFARRRENLELVGRGERTAILVGLLQLLSLGTLAYLVPEARSTTSLMLLILMALVFGLIAVVNAARLASDTAEVVDVAPGPVIPSATVL